MSIPISTGSGVASVAAEAVGGLQYQQVEIYGQGGSSVLGVNPDRSISVSIIGIPNVGVAGGSVGLLGGTAFIGNVGIASGSVIALASGNQSVSGTVGASIIGAVPIQLGNSSVITYVQNSVATVIIGGSISASFTPPANQSVSGTVGASVIGAVPVQLSNSSVITYVQNSVAAVIIGGSIAASFTPPANQSVSGTVGASIIGAVPVQLANSSIITVSQNSSIITIWQSSSVLAVPVGSTIAVLQSPSIVGTYAEDAGHTSGDKGLFALGVRNDLQSSITSADLDYSPIAVGPTGALIATDAPITKWIQGTADLRVVLGSSVTALAAQGASVFTYIREIQVANFGPSSVLVTFGGGLGSILGYTIAPAGGGSNFVTRLKTGENSAFTASINGTASVLVSVQGFTAKI